MKYIELYSDQVLEAASLGHTTSDFDELSGDYVKVDVYTGDDASGTPEVSVYSNRLLMKNEADEYYFGDYHYHGEKGFMAGKNHTEDTHDILYPIPEDIDSNIREEATTTSEYQKQLILYADTNDNLYIKPNEFLRYHNLQSGKRKLVVHFLRDFKCDISDNLSILNNNYIENGNFFAGLEATQTGDLDHSNGHNKFIRMSNPGLGNYCLEQNGHRENNYNMQITGMETNCTYIFSCWVAWDDKFDAAHSITDFENDWINVATTEGVWTSDVGGTKLKNGTRDLDSVEIDGLKWHRRFLKFSIPNPPDFSGDIIMKIGYNPGGNVYPPKFRQSNKTTGRRYFTDLRLEKVMDDVDCDAYMKKYMGDGYPVQPTPDNNDIHMYGSGSHSH